MTCLTSEQLSSVRGSNDRKSEETFRAGTRQSDCQARLLSLMMDDMSLIVPKHLGNFLRPSATITNTTCLL